MSALVGTRNFQAIYKEQATSWPNLAPKQYFGLRVVWDANITNNLNDTSQSNLSMVKPFGKLTVAGLFTLIGDVDIFWTPDKISHL